MQRGENVIQAAVCFFWDFFFCGSKKLHHCYIEVLYMLQFPIITLAELGMRCFEGTREHSSSGAVDLGICLAEMNSCISWLG